MDCYSLNVCVPPRFLCWTLVALCDGGTFGRCLGGDDGACRNGTSAFITKRPQPVLPCESTLRRHQLYIRKEGLTKLDRADTFVLDFRPPELWEINVWLYMCHPVCDILPLQPKWTKIWVNECKSHETDLGPSMKECPNNMSLWVLNEPAWCTAKFPISGSIPAKTTT